MTKGTFKFWIAAHLALLLFAISPLAGIGGIVVAAALVAPIGIVLGLTGTLEAGRGFDGQLETIFWVWLAIMVMAAFWQSYLSAGHFDKDEPERGRARLAVAMTLVVLPAVVGLCYQSLGF